MKINFVQIIIAIALSALISYGLFSFHNGENRILLSVGSFLVMSSTLALSLGMSFEMPRTTTNIRVVAGIFFSFGLISNMIFTFSDFSSPSYVIINGILLLLFLLIAYSINKAKQ